ncbi:MAG: hypothetical protein AB8G23_14145 [Myxococcota bacterium]
MSPNPAHSEPRLDGRKFGCGLFASLALLALFASWLPHDHHAGSVASDPSSAAEFDSGLSLSADDAHHTHSSSPELDDLLCTLCRSDNERDDFLVAKTPALAAVLSTAPHSRRPEPARKAAPHAHHHFGRAPPFAFAS